MLPPARTFKRNLKLGTGTLTYHLDVLKREKIVRSQSRGVRKPYFPADVAMPEDGGGLHEIQLRILKVAEEQPGLTVRDLAGVLGVSGELTRYHDRGLQGMGKVRAERSGPTLCVYHPKYGLVFVDNLQEPGRAANQRRRSAAFRVSQAVLIRTFSRDCCTARATSGAERRRKNAWTSFARAGVVNPSLTWTRRRMRNPEGAYRR